MSIFHKIYQGIQDACYIWREELKQVLHDEGVLIFCVVVPLIYPLLYSWIYNNEVVREVPVVVVDQSHSQLSRQFIRMCDASPDVKVFSHANDLDEAKSLVSRQLAKGIYLIPADFATNINRGQQGVVSVYCDMALILTYKAIYQTAVGVSQTMGKELQTKLLGNYTTREDIVATSPLDCEDVPVFNPGGGYGSSVLPAVLMLILQQTLVLGIGLAAGTARERNRYSDLVPIHRCYSGVFRIVGGKSMCYFMIYILMSAYLTLVVPRMFSFPTLIHWPDLVALLLPYILASIFFGLSVSCLVHYRENVMLLVVFVSIPLLFMSGISWPQTSIPGYWQGISWLFPSTFGIRAFIRMNTMGGVLSDVLPEIRYLWIQTAAYFGLACIVYGFELNESRNHAHERYETLKKKRALRLQMKAKASKK